MIGMYRPAIGGNPETFLGIEADTWIDVLVALRRVGLKPEQARELTDRVVFADKHGGTIHITADGPRLDDESEVLFIVGREVRS